MTSVWDTSEQMGDDLPRRHLAWMRVDGTIRQSLPIPFDRLAYLRWLPDEQLLVVVEEADGYAIYLADVVTGAFWRAASGLPAPSYPAATEDQFRWEKSVLVSESGRRVAIWTGTASMQTIYHFDLAEE